MPVTPKELGRRLRLAREACQMTQDDVAIRIGVARPVIAQMESGSRKVGSLELSQLADLYARDLREFVAEEFGEQDALAALFRAQLEIAAEGGILEMVRECMRLGTALGLLEQQLGIARNRPAPSAYDLAEPRTRWEAIQQGQRIAEEERRRLGLGQAPIADLAQLLDSQGIRIAVVALPDEISGLTLIDPATVGTFIVVRKADRAPRRRYSLAHEYAHVLLDRDRRGVVSRVTERDRLIEVRANSFAACFLMPAEGLREFVAQLGKGFPSRSTEQVFFDAEDSLLAESRTEPGSQDLQLYDVVQIAAQFAVSRLAALYRLKNLRLVTDAEFERMKQQDAAGKGKAIVALLGLEDLEMQESRNDFRHRFLALAIEAYRREIITREKVFELARMVAVPRDDMLKVLADSGLTGEFEEGDVHLPGCS